MATKVPVFIVLLVVSSMFVISIAKPKKPPPQLRSPPPPPQLRSPPPPPQLRPPPPPPRASTRPIFSIYILALEWPVSVVLTENKLNTDVTKLPLKFTIHGLWPQIEVENVKAKAEEFDVTKLTSIKDKLVENWITVENSDSGTWERRHEEFWRSEWNKHGKDSSLGLLEYFTLALDLHQAVQNFYTLKDLKGDYPPGALIDVAAFKNEFASFGMPGQECAQSLGRNPFNVLKELQFKVSSGSRIFLNNTIPDKNCKIGETSLPGNKKRLPRNMP